MKYTAGGTNHPLLQRGSIAGDRQSRSSAVTLARRIRSLLSLSNYWARASTHALTTNGSQTMSRSISTSWDSAKPVLANQEGAPFSSARSCTDCGQQAASQGQSIIACSGDSGSLDLFYDRMTVIKKKRDRSLAVRHTGDDHSARPLTVCRRHSWEGCPNRKIMGRRKPGVISKTARVGRYKDRPLR